jgi:hypothetical protein
MPRNGSGTFNRIYDWTTDQANGINCEADRMDEEFDGMATALSNSIAKDGQTTITANIPFNSKKITGLANGSARTDSIALGQVQDNSYGTLGTLGGSADTYTASPSPAITAYATGMEFNLKVNADNTGASTLNISAVGAKNIKKYDGAGSKIDLEAGDLQQDQYYKAIYDGTDFILLNPEIINNLKSNNLTVNDKLNTKPNIATISSGAITYTGAYMVVDTEGGASSDTLDTISGGAAGDRLLLRGATSGRNIIISDNTGNIQTNNNTNFTLEPTHIDSAEFYYDGSNWIQTARRLELDFRSSKSQNGYTYLPNGLILQWGVAINVGGNSTQSVTLPITYPNAIWMTQATAGTTANINEPVNSYSQTNSSITVRNSSTSTVNIYWFTIGN